MKDKFKIFNNVVYEIGEALTHTDQIYFSEGTEYIILKPMYKNNNNNNTEEDYHWTPDMDILDGELLKNITVYSRGDYNLLVRLPNTCDGIGISVKRVYPLKFIKKLEENETFVPTNTQNTEFTDKHYNFNYTLTENDIKTGSIKLDPYFVSNVWKLGEKDNSGVLWHIVKGIARFGDKNPKEREIRAMYASIKRLAELHNIELN